MKIFATALAAVLLAACSKNIQTKEAIRDAVVEYLNARQTQTGLDMSKMTVEVVNMSFGTNTAHATVAFNLKTGEGGMQMPYDLERQGNKWVVKGTTATGANPHATTGGGQVGTSSELPPNHPAIGSTPIPAGPLPAGHPPVDPKGK